MSLVDVVFGTHVNKDDGSFTIYRCLICFCVVMKLKLYEIEHNNRLKWEVKLDSDDRHVVC